MKFIFPEIYKLTRRYTKMKLSKTITLSLLLLIACGGSGSSNNPDSNIPQTPPTIQSVLDESVRQGLDGIVIYAENNQEVTINSAGYHNNDTLASASSNSLFKIASVSKLFIATASVQLINNGTINENDTIGDWLPELTSRIENSQSITIENLLLHRSGVPDFDSQTGFSWENSHLSIDDTLEFALDKPADFSPDARYEYSNTNYLLIAKIIDRSLGYDHKTYIQESILTPLQLDNTFQLVTQVDMSLLAKGYWSGTDVTEHQYLIPGGSMVSTVEDTATFLRALADGTLLNQDEQSLYLSYFGGFTHSGWVPGYQSIARYHADIDTVLIQFVNSTGSNSENISGSTYNQVKALLD